MTTNDKQLEKHIAARRWAEERFEAIEDKRSFVQRVCELAEGSFTEALVPRKPELVPMTDEESKAFDEQTMPFGIHQGEKIKTIRLGYLISLTEDSPFIRDFFDKIKRYLKSPRIQREIGRGEGL